MTGLVRPSVGLSVCPTRLSRTGSYNSKANRRS